MYAAFYQSAILAVAACFIFGSQAAPNHAHTASAAHYSPFDSWAEEARDCFQNPRAPSVGTVIPDCWSKNVKLLLSLMEHNLGAVPASVKLSYSGKKDGGCGKGTGTGCGGVGGQRQGGIIGNLNEGGSSSFLGTVGRASTKIDHTNTEEVKDACLASWIKWKPDDGTKGGFGGFRGFRGQKNGNGRNRKSSGWSGQIWRSFKEQIGPKWGDGSGGGGGGGGGGGSSSGGGGSGAGGSGGSGEGAAGGGGNYYCACSRTCSYWNGYGGQPYC